MREERGNEMRQMKGKISKFETREDSEDLYISGYFAVFGSDYELWPGATESVADTAFDGALSDDIRCLADHETRLVLGSRHPDAQDRQPGAVGRGSDQPERYGRHEPL